MLKRFISYYRPHRRLFILDMLASLAVSLVGILYPIITRLMLNDLIPEKRYRTIILCGAGLLLLYIVRMLLNYFIQFYGHVMGVRMQAQMRSDMFRHLERLPYSFYDNHETGKIMSRMTNDLQDISELAHHGPENLITSTVSVIVSFTYLHDDNQDGKGSQQPLHSQSPQFLIPAPHLIGPDPLTPLTELFSQIDSIESGHQGQ